MARNVLTDRLRRLVESGVMERVPYQQRPQRYEYQLTATGRELAVPVIGLMHWGDRHLAGPSGATIDPPQGLRWQDSHEADVRQVRRGRTTSAAERATWPRAAGASSPGDDAMTLTMPDRSSFAPGEPAGSP